MSRTKTQQARGFDKEVFTMAHSIIVKLTNDHSRLRREVSFQGLEVSSLK